MNNRRGGPAFHFPTEDNVSNYVTTERTEREEKPYNINDYLPGRRTKPSLKTRLPPFEITLRTSNNTKDQDIYSEKIRTLESRINELMVSKEVKTTVENTQTEMSSFEKPTKLGWGPRIQLTIVPPTKRYQQMTAQTDSLPTETHPPPPPPPTPTTFVPKLQLPPLTTQRFSRASDIAEYVQKIRVTDRNKENKHTQRDMPPIFKEDSVDLYPVRIHEVADLVRLMLCQ